MPGSRPGFDKEVTEVTQKCEPQGDTFGGGAVKVVRSPPYHIRGVQGYSPTSWLSKPSLVVVYLGIAMTP